MLFFFFKLILGLFPISPRFGVAVYPPSQSSADGDSSAELYLTHLEPSRHAHKARRRCSPLTVSHVLPVKFLVPRPPHITFISFIYAAWATVTRGNPHLTDTSQTVYVAHAAAAAAAFQPTGNSNLSRDHLVSTGAPALPGFKPHPPRSSPRNPRLHARPGAGGRMPRPHPRPCTAGLSYLLHAHCGLRKWRTRYNQLLHWLSPRKGEREGKHGAEPGRWLERSGGRVGLGPEPDSGWWS